MDIGQHSVYEGAVPGLMLGWIVGYLHPHLHPQQSSSCYNLRWAHGHGSWSAVPCWIDGHEHATIMLQSPLCVCFSSMWMEDWDECIRSVIANN